MSLMYFRRVAGFIAAFVTGATLSSAAQAQSAVFLQRWFSPDSVWNTPIGNAPVAPYSQGAIAAWIASGKTINMNRDIWTPAVIYTDGVSDPQKNLTFVDGLKRPWVLQNVPISPALLKWAAYHTSKGDTDGMTCLYSEKLRGFFSMWGVKLDSTGKSVIVNTGGFTPIAGNGWSATSTVPSPNGAQGTPGLGRAAGASYCGGVIRWYEFRSGHIDHALALMWNNGLVRSLKLGSTTALQYPARFSDGLSTDTSTSIPYGARLQLDPSLTDTQLKMLGLIMPGDLIVAHALQKYGAYMVDVGWSAGALSFESGFGNGIQQYPVTNPMPKAVYKHLRFVGPPAALMPLDTAKSAGNPVIVGN